MGTEVWRHQISVFAFQYFHGHISVEHDEKPSHTKFYMNWFMGPEIWPHEYLISHIERCVNWPGSLNVWNQTNFHAALSWAPINRYPQTLGCGGFSSCSTDICGIRNAEMQESFLWRHYFGTLYGVHWEKCILHPRYYLHIKLKLTKCMFCTFSWNHLFLVLKH